MATRQTALSISTSSDSDSDSDSDSKNTNDYETPPSDSCDSEASSCDSESDEAEIMATELEFYSLGECWHRRYQRAHMKALMKAQMKAQMKAERRAERKAEMRGERRAQRAYSMAAAGRTGLASVRSNATVQNRALLESAARVRTLGSTNRAATATTMKNVSDAHVLLLVASYRRHYAEYCKQKGHVTQQFPFVVWQKVHGDFLKALPGTKFDVALLKTQLRQGLQKYRNTPLPDVSVDMKPTPLAAMAQGATSMNANPVPLVAAMQVPSQLAIRSTTAMIAAVAQVPVSVDAKPTQIAMMQSSVAPSSGMSKVANGSAQAASSNNVNLMTPVVKSEPVDPIVAAPTTTSAAVVHKSVLDSGSVNGISSREPSLTDSSCSANGTASNNQGASEDSRQLSPQKPSEDSLKRRKRSNQVELQELKKQKLVLENLKLELELGLITPKESIEGGKRVLQM